MRKASNPLSFLLSCILILSINELVVLQHVQGAFCTSGTIYHTSASVPKTFRSYRSTTFVFDRVSSLTRNGHRYIPRQQQEIPSNNIIVRTAVADENSDTNIFQDDIDLFTSLPDYTKQQLEEGQLPVPNPNINSAKQVVQICMDFLLTNDTPHPNAGLEVTFNFSSDRCRAALGGTLENFIEYASNPTFGSMINAIEYNILKIGPIIEGTPTRGAMQTILVDVQPKTKQDDRKVQKIGNQNEKEALPKKRQFLWTLQKERRPPNTGCWLVHECIFVENAFSLTI